MKGTILCLFLIMALNAYCSERSVTFGDLLKINESDLSNFRFDDDIQISGFLYKDSGGNIFLSNNPGLKSCCIGHFKEGTLQIRVIDLPLNTIIKEGELRQVKGSLSWNREKDAPFFYLRKSSLMDKSGSNPVTLVSAVIALFFLSFLFLKRAARYGEV